jgi:glycosyltransferase involved in cell wall biosynthesis
MPRSYEQEPADGPLAAEGFEYYSLAQEVFRDGSYVRRLSQSVRPDCIVSVNAWPSPTAVGIHDCPLWVDLNGHVMAEGQSKAFRINGDTPIADFFKLEYPIICNADIFSAVAEAQKWALIGELGLVGRLNRFTDNYGFCHVIPNGLEQPIPKPTTMLLRGRKLDENDFVILWSGGFNTWCDYEVLVAALEELMARYPHVKFVATGGQINGHDDVSYPRFQRLVSQSQYRERFILEGWIPADLLPHYYYESDIGINVDRDCYEVRLGSKNRILDWMSTGLPPVCSRVCELSLLLEKTGAGFTYAPGSKVALVDCLTRIIQSPREELKCLRERVKSVGIELLGFDNIMVPLRDWVRDPRFAPDQGRYVRLVRPAASHHEQEGSRTNALD